MPSSSSSMSSMLSSSLPSLPSLSYPSASAYPFASTSTSATRNNSSSCNRKVGQGRRKRMATMNRSSSSSSSSLSLLVLLVSLFVFCCNNNNSNNNNMLLFANAFSSSSTSTTPTTTTTTTTTTATKKKKNRIEYFNPDIDTIENDHLLIAIQECRRTSFPVEKKNFMDAERDFIAAKNVLSKKKICVIIFDNNEKENEFPKIVGTADLQPQYNYIKKQKQFIPKGIISNVFVRPDERGKKFGQQLMIEGIEQILVPELYNNILEDPTAIAEAQSKGITLTLDVYTQNTPALQLYFKLGYRPDGPINEGVYKLSQLLNSNLFITLTKTIPL